nr:MAG TPA: hypothetical protein [Caudoviricetes sp.]
MESSYCVHDFNLSNLYLCGVGLAVVVSLSHIQRKDLKGVKYRKGRAIHITLLQVTTSISEERRT